MKKKMEEETMKLAHFQLGFASSSILKVRYSYFQLLLAILMTPKLAITS